MGPVSSAPREDVQVGPYRLLSPLGEGGMGVVHLAMAPDGRRVALKVLRPHVVGDAEARERLAREVSTMRRIESPRVAEVIDADPDGPVPYVVTRYVPGLSLHHHVAQEGTLSERDLVHAMGCLAQALAAVHAVGVLHRDIKPTNVLMEGRAPVLIDFGLAKLAEDPRLTQTGWLMGTPGYLAPEVLHGQEPTTASDVFSWAATLAFGALGRPPYGTGPTMAVLDRVRRGEHDLEAVPGPARELLEACLRPEPEQRPALAEIAEWTRRQSEALEGGPAAQPRNGDAAALWTMPFVAPEPESDPVAGPTEVHAAPSGPAEAPTRVQPAVPATPPGFHEVAPHQEPPPFRSRLGERDPHPSARTVPPGPAPGSPYAAAPWDVAPSRPQRWLQLAGLGALATALVAYAPYLGTALVALVVLVLRSVSVGRQRAARRLRLRGRSRWYDAPLSVLASPTYAARALGGTLAGVVLGGFVGLAMFSVGYLASQPLSTGLVLAGIGLSATLWWGPGSSRLRETTYAVVDRTARSEFGGWLLGVMALLGAAGLLALLLSSGANWAPALDAPLD